MSWTHDDRDVTHKHFGAASASGGVPAAHLQDREQLLGIPRIIGRRARWMGARLRHSARNG